MFRRSLLHVLTRWEFTIGKERMHRDSATRIGAAADRDPSSATAVSGFADRADAAATRNTGDKYDEFDNE